MSTEQERFERLGQKLGEASMCWEPRPTGAFLSDAVSMILQNLAADVEDWIEEAVAALADFIGYTLGEPQKILPAQGTSDAPVGES